MLLITFTFKQAPSFFPPPIPLRKERKCTHPEYAEQGCMAIFPLAEVVTWSGWGMCQPSPLTPPIRSPSFHRRVSFIQRKRAGPKQAHLQHSARAVGHLKGGCVCLWKRKRGGGRLHSKWHLMLVSPQCCLINHAGLNFTKSATELDVWCWRAPVDSF